MALTSHLVKKKQKDLSLSYRQFASPMPHSPHPVSNSPPSPPLPPTLSPWVRQVTIMYQPLRGSLSLPAQNLLWKLVEGPLNAPSTNLHK